MDLWKWGRNLALLSLPLMLTACVSASEHNALQAQVNQMNRQMSSSQTNQADSWSQLMELRQEVAELRGQLDTLNYALQRAGGAQKLAETVALHDRALRLAESQMALDLQLTPDTAVQGMPGAAPGMTPGMVPGAGTGDASAQPSLQPAAPAVPAAQPQGNVDMAQALYDNGMQAFNNRQYQAALRSFSDFTKTYSKNKLVSNAWFWQGECQYQMKNYAEAVLAYENVISGYPNSVKAPASYLKQGMSFLQLNKKAAAKQRLTELTRKYPKAPEATRARQVIKQNKL
ncbi:tol-pal system protein YbgF [Mailhella massiliensis]|uniref:Tol-pal system protein YbgF n=1 Tax=Mailhella massiliensis TaxID=1903261 RepID=A0A921AXQ2_9BACT|nr:tol-pal system protein YbgF [Mailhella massiliensis]HJD98250.1 tol-pal system protein YbgF [Mailhella massiliensis]